MDSVTLRREQQQEDREQTGKQIPAAAQQPQEENQTPGASVFTLPLTHRTSSSGLRRALVDLDPDRTLTGTLPNDLQAVRRLVQELLDPHSPVTADDS